MVLWDKYLILTYSVSVIFNYRYQSNKPQQKGQEQTWDPATSLLHFNTEQGQVNSMPEVAEEMLAATLISLPIANYHHLKMKNKVKLNHRLTKV